MLSTFSTLLNEWLPLYIYETNVSGEQFSIVTDTTLYQLCLQVSPLHRTALLQGIQDITQDNDKMP